MSISANVGAFENEFVAALSDGRCLGASDLRALASALHDAGVAAEAVQYDWRPGRRMVTAGQQVALSAEIRGLERNRAGFPIAA